MLGAQARFDLNAQMMRGLAYNIAALSRAKKLPNSKSFVSGRNQAGVATTPDEINQLFEQLQSRMKGAADD